VCGKICSKGTVGNAWEGDIKIDFKGIRRKGVNGTRLAHERDQCPVLVNMAYNSQDA